MRPFEQAWRLLKMPVVDTNVPGVQMAYGIDVEEPVIGNMPYMWGGDDQITQMTPNEYFDAINQNTENIRGLPRVPSRNAPYRWDNRQFNEHGDSRANIARIIEGIKSGMPIGMPELEFRNDKYSGFQEGGHRMEALRQMGHADTPVPVFRHNRYVKEKPDNSIEALTEDPNSIFYGTDPKHMSTLLHTGEPMDIAMRLLKGRSILIGDTFYPVNQPTLFGQTMLERARDIQTESKNTQPTKRNTGLNYYVTVPRNDLGSNLLSRRYAIRRGDTDEIIGSLPMSPVYSNPREQMRFLRKPTGDFKPTRSNIDREHRGQNLYARALMGILSAGDAGAPIVSTERNEMSEGSHRNLMDMHSRAGGNLESLRDGVPAEESDGVRYNQIFNDGYGSLRTNDPGGLPVRVIDAPSSVQYPKYKQTNLEDFGMEDERFYLPFD